MRMNHPLFKKILCFSCWISYPCLKYRYHTAKNEDTGMKQQIAQPICKEWTLIKGVNDLYENTFNLCKDNHFEIEEGKRNGCKSKKNCFFHV